MVRYCGARLFDCSQNRFQDSQRALLVPFSPCWQGNVGDLDEYDAPTYATLLWSYCKAVDDVVFPSRFTASFQDPERLVHAI